MNDRFSDIGKLALRLAFGGMMLTHGIPKLGKLLEGGGFADPIGIGQTPSLVLAVFAELGCSALLVIGLFTRAATVPLIITMAVAAFIVHGGDPWKKKEMAVLYLSAYAAIAAIGPGRLSVDWLWRGRNKADVESSEGIS